MKLISLSILFAVLSCLTGCYHVGTPGNFHVALGDLTVVNPTKEAKLKPLMIASIREHICGDPAATLDKSPENVFQISIRFKDMKNHYVARAKMRDTQSRDDDSDAYQSVLFRIVITADVTVSSHDGKTVILSKTYQGQGDLPNMHDRELPLQQACKQAVNSIADQIVDDLATSK